MAKIISIMALAMLAAPAAAHSAPFKSIAELVVEGSGFVCVGFSLIDSTQSDDQYCDVDARLVLLNAKLAYYRSSDSTYFFYSGAYSFRFRCEITVYEGTRATKKVATTLHKVLFLQGGYEYVVTPLLTFGSTTCKLKVKQKKAPGSSN